MNNKSKIGLAVGVALAAVVAGGVWMALNPTPEPIYGMVQAKTVDVASKVTGRVESFDVREGDMVEIGQTVALLNIPEVEAKLKEVHALEVAASAKAGNASSYDGASKITSSSYNAINYFAIRYKK